jgi:ferredoxin-NADP reductase
VLYDSLFRLEKGTPIELHGPMGKFALPEGSGPFYFLAGGTGVTPFRSMVKFLLDQKPEVENWLFHSVRTPEDLVFQEEFLQWGTAKNSFHYVPTFTQYSGIDPDKETGRIGEVLLRKHLPNPAGVFLLCGPAAFVNDLEALLKHTMQIKPEQIRREQW